jgi:hypothetical protein
MHLDEIVPFGRGYDDYVRMFDLSEADLGRRILACADGPAGFNAGMHARGLRVVSVDPIYRFSAEELRGRIRATFETVIEQARAHREQYVWDDVGSVEDLARLRMAAMEAFLADFEAGKREGRYLPHELPDLPFAAGGFDLALCSHFLFLYTDHLSLQFHCDAVREMCRVAGEARVFPLLDLESRPSRYVEPVCAGLRAEGYACEVLPVPYEFQRGGNRMLRVTRGQGEGAPAVDTRP